MLVSAGPSWLMLVQCWSRLVYAGIVLIQAGLGYQRPNQTNLRLDQNIET